MIPHVAGPQFISTFSTWTFLHSTDFAWPHAWDGFTLLFIRQYILSAHSVADTVSCAKNKMMSKIRVRLCHPGQTGLVPRRGDRLGKRQFQHIAISAGTQGSIYSTWWLNSRSWVLLIFPDYWSHLVPFCSPWLSWHWVLRVPYQQARSHPELRQMDGWKVSSLRATIWGNLDLFPRSGTQWFRHNC